MSQWNFKLKAIQFYLLPSFVFIVPGKINNNKWLNSDRTVYHEFKDKVLRRTWSFRVCIAFKLKLYSSLFYDWETVIQHDDVWSNDFFTTFTLQILLKIAHSKHHFNKIKYQNFQIQFPIFLISFILHLVMYNFQRKCLMAI